jgi:tight adherence protein B
VEGRAVSGPAWSLTGWDLTGWALVLVACAAAMALVDALWNLWQSRHGPEARRLARRLKAAQDPLATPAAAVARAPGEDRWPRVRAFLAGHAAGRAVQARIDASGTGWQVPDALLAGLGLACTLGLGVRLLLPAAGAVPALAGGVIGLALPWLWLAGRRRQHIERIERQFPQALDLIGRALRAGHALPGAVRLAAEELPDPLVRDFRRLFEEINVGVAVPQALQRFAQRVALPDAAYFTVAVTLQRESGGNLAEVLDAIAALVRDRLRLRGEVRTHAAEGRLSAVVLAVLPFAVALVVQVMNPGFLAVLWTDETGRQMVAAALAGIVVGVGWMRAIVRIRV